jgi:hypothetical protein
MKLSAMKPRKAQHAFSFPHFEVTPKHFHCSRLLAWKLNTYKVTEGRVPPAWFSTYGRSITIDVTTCSCRYGRSRNTIHVFVKPRFNWFMVLLVHSYMPEDGAHDPQELKSAVQAVLRGHRNS